MAILLDFSLTSDKRLTPYLSALDFCNSPVWNIEFDELEFFPSLTWIFHPAVACKIKVHQTGFSN